MSVYGYCYKCGDEVRVRERRPNGNDTCARGHVSPSAKTLTKALRDERFPAERPVVHQPPRPDSSVRRTETHWTLGEVQVMEALRRYLGLPEGAKITATNGISDQGSPVSAMVVSLVETVSLEGDVPTEQRATSKKRG